MNFPTTLLLLCSLVFLLQGGVNCKIKSSSRNYKNVEVPVTGAERNAKIEMLLKAPKATFFTGENMTGEIINYDSTNTTWLGGCQALDNNGITSWRVSESCVRVFWGSWCSGSSLSLYPKPTSGSYVNFIEPSPGLNGVRSIGPCLPNEFNYASVSLTGPRISVTKDETTNDHQVPDAVDFDGWELFSYNYKEGTVPNTSATNSIREYYMEKGRPKWIRAWFRSSRLRNGTESTAERNHVIPPRLGGPRNESYNTFPQSESNFVEWKKVTDQIEPYLRANLDSSVGILLTFAYKGPSVTQPPYGFFYRIIFLEAAETLKTISYGFVEN